MTIGLYPLGLFPVGIESTTVATPATAITISGPSSGPVGEASTNFNIGADGLITGTIVVTPSDGGAGGTFTPASVSISAGIPNESFTYTPSTVGTKSIVVTNNGGLSNPASHPYLSSAAPVWTEIPNQIAIVGISFSLDLSDYCTDPEADEIDYSVAVGSLPSGLALDGNTGIISGTPDTFLEVQDVSFLAEDEHGATSSQSNTVEFIVLKENWLQTEGFMSIPISKGLVVKPNGQLFPRLKNT